ncbi:MAG: sugar phosphate isomerase/epimerase family protein, partial [Actinomycetes bacterium]
VQGANPRRCRELGLVPTTFAIHRELGGLDQQCRRWVDLGVTCCTVMLGDHLIGDDEAARLVEEVLVASVSSGLPLYVETHRATVTQDIARTLRLVDRFPELRFNGDLSHWYTGHELGLTDMEETVDVLAPVLDRVRFLHGRIGTSGCMQIDVGDGNVGDVPSVGHFELLWTRAMQGFIVGASEDPVPPVDLQMGFAPELLPPEVGYARTFTGPDGHLREEGDRWSQALVLTDIAQRCFARAAESALG